MTRYDENTRRQAVARALIVGPKRAALDMRLPPRTVADWWHDPRYLAEVDETTRQHLASELWTTMTEALFRLRKGLADPRTRLHDVAYAYQVLRDSHALLSGGATSRVESTSMSLTASVNAGLSEEQVADVRDAIDAFLRAKDAEEAIVTIEDPTAALDRQKIGSLIAAIERRLGDGR